MAVSRRRAPRSSLQIRPRRVINCRGPSGACSRTMPRTESEPHYKTGVLIIERIVRSSSILHRVIQGSSRRGWKRTVGRNRIPAPRVNRATLRQVSSFVPG